MTSWDTSRMVLNAALNSLASRGWTQGRFVDAAGARCVSQAIADAAVRFAGPEDVAVVRHRAERALQMYLGTTVQRWNELPDQTITTITQGMRNCIAEMVWQ